jgi:serine/threonine-protein kinase SRPK3
MNIPLLRLRCTVTRVFRPNIQCSRNRHSSAIEEDPKRYVAGGYHPVSPGITLNNRYSVLRKLGFGQNSTVWLATDHCSGNAVSLKILTAESSHDPVLNEIRWLNILGIKDLHHPDFKLVQTLLDCFRVRGPNGTHSVLVTIPMGVSLLELGKTFEDGKVPIRLAKQIARQMLLGLDYTHHCGIIHCGSSVCSRN